MKHRIKPGLAVCVFVGILNGALAANDRSEKYRVAIERAAADKPPKVGISLRRCVATWKYYPDKQAEFDSLSKQSIGTPASVVVEIGNAGFSRYDFLIVEHNFVRSSFGRRASKLTAGLRTDIEKLGAVPASELHDAGTLEEFDGDCYFVTIARAAGSHVVAIYGTPTDSELGELINRLLEVPR